MTTRRYKRRIEFRDLRDRILIICEGKGTEPRYFENFPINKKVVDIDVRGIGRNTDSLVEKVVAIKNEEERNGKKYNQVWCVFDKDSFTPHNFNRAIQLAENNKIRVAYSNQAFELWFLLHFNYQDAAVPRQSYVDKLTESLGYEYKKKSSVIDDVYRDLKDKQNAAIKRAKKLYNSYPTPNPLKNDPSTSVHTLVEEIRKFI